MCNNHRYHYVAELIKVIDGDTLDLKIDLGFGIFLDQRIRLAYINCSEVYGVKKISDEYKKGFISKCFVEKAFVTHGKVCKIETIRDKKCKYGRRLAQVYLSNGDCLNDLLLDKGLAKKVSYKSCRS